MINLTELKSIKKEQILSIFNKEKSFSCTIPYTNHEIEALLSDVLITLFEFVQKPHIGSSLTYCLAELVGNANKANIKRLFFQKQGLDINRQDDYEKGIKTFREDLLKNIREYETQMTSSSPGIQLFFAIENSNFIIKIVNTSRMCMQEEERILQRFKLADKFNNIQEVMAYGLDTTEGAGFGLMIVILTLRKIGLNENIFTYHKGDNTTSFFISIPLNLLSRTQSLVIAQEITKEIESMPQFPESLLRLQKNLSDPNCDFISVSKIIKTDPSLATEVIRIANSPIYMLPRKVDDVYTAVRMIGLKGIRNLVLSYGVSNVFQKKYKKELIDEVLRHSYRVAVYTSYLVKTKRIMKVRDDVFVAALLHDMGKIVVNTLQPTLFMKIEKVCVAKGIPVSTIEDLTDGYNHSLIGAQLADKWQFPEKFVQSIKYHHIPLETNEEYKVMVFAVYLGNEIYYYLKGERKFKDINFKVLQFFGLGDKNDFDDLIRGMKKISME